MTNHPLWGSLEKTCFIHIAVHKHSKSILIEIFHKKYTMILRLLYSMRYFINTTWFSVKYSNIPCCNCWYTYKSVRYGQVGTYFVMDLFWTSYLQTRTKSQDSDLLSICFFLSRFLFCVMNGKMSLISFTIIMICEFNNPFFQMKASRANDQIIKTHVFSYLYKKSKVRNWRKN